MKGGPLATRRALLVALAYAPWHGRGALAADTAAGVLRMIMPQAPGGAADFLARLLAKDMARGMDRPVVVESRPGGGTIVGARAVARAAPDGNTIGMVFASLAINQAMRHHTPYNALTDFEAICLGGHSIVVLVTHPGFAADNMAQAIELMRRADPPLQYASLGTGSMSHLAGALLAIEADVPLEHVAYNGSAEIYRALSRGDLPLAFVTLESALPHFGAGRLRALGITSARRAAGYPQLPAIAEFVPGFELEGFFGFVAPAHTPAPLVAELSTEIARALQTPSVHDRLLSGGFVVSVGPPAVFMAFLRQQIEKYAALAKRTGITLD